MNIQKYERHSTASIEEIISLIQHATKDQPRNRDIRVKAEVNGIKVGVSSIRLRTFADKGVECISCGSKASFFAIERIERRGNKQNNDPYHLNLWGLARNGEEILFTHDHTLARSLGGSDSLNNTQTMCCFCNWEKGKKESDIKRRS